MMVTNIAKITNIVKIAKITNLKVSLYTNIQSIQDIQWINL